MFKILGADGKEYGPVPAEELRRWISEGRAGAQTQVRADGSDHWIALQTVPEFAALLRSPMAIPASERTAPPVVRTLAWAMFVVAGVSALILLANLISVLRVTGIWANPWYIAHWATAALCLPARIIIGIGLLRGRGCARWLAIGLSSVLAVYGGWGLARMVTWFAEHPESVTPSLMSPMYLISSGWSVATFAFNIFTILLLCRRDVREFFAGKKSAGAQ